MATSLFGFRKQDVMDYIEQLRKDNDDLSRDNKELQMRLSDSVSRISSLEKDISSYKDLETHVEQSVSVSEKVIEESKERTDEVIKHAKDNLI